MTFDPSLELDELRARIEELEAERDAALERARVAEKDTRAAESREAVFRRKLAKANPLSASSHPQSCGSEETEKRRRLPPSEEQHEVGEADSATARIAALEAEVEHERLRFAACGVVALANTPEVDREMGYRARIAALEAETIKLETFAIGLPTFDADGPGDCADRQIAAIQNRIAALEAERDAFRQRVAELGLLEENLESYKTQWKRHLDEENDKFMRSKQNEAFDALYRLGELLALDEWSAGTLVDEVEARLEVSRARIAALEAERDQLKADHSQLLREFADIYLKEKP